MPSPRIPCWRRRRPGSGMPWDVHTRPRVSFCVGPICPARGTTGDEGHRLQQGRISTHAPVRGATSQQVCRSRLQFYFNPRAPQGARPPTSTRRRREDAHFNPRAPRGARRQKCAAMNASIGFQPTRPVRGATWLDTLAELIESKAKTVEDAAAIIRAKVEQLKTGPGR